MTTLPPRIAAIRTRGRRIFHIIFASVPPSPRLASIFRISGKEICTFPVLIFKTVTIKNAAVNTENTRIYLERRLKIPFDKQIRPYPADPFSDYKCLPRYISPLMKNQVNISFCPPDSYYTVLFYPVQECHILLISICQHQMNIRDQITDYIRCLIQ